MEKLIVDLDQVLNDFEQSEQNRQSLNLERASIKSSNEINRDDDDDDDHQTSNTAKPINQNQQSLLQQPTSKILQEQLVNTFTLTSVDTTSIINNEHKSNVDLLSGDSTRLSSTSSQLLLPDLSTLEPETNKENIENQDLLTISDDISFLVSTDQSTGAAQIPPQSTSLPPPPLLINNKTNIVIDLLSEDCDNQICDKPLILPQTPVKTKEKSDQDNQTVDDCDQNQSFQTDFKDILSCLEETGRKPDIDLSNEEEVKEEEKEKETIKSINLNDLITESEADENRLSQPTKLTEQVDLKSGQTWSLESAQNLKSNDKVDDQTSLVSESELQNKTDKELKTGEEKVDSSIESAQLEVDSEYLNESEPSSFKEASQSQTSFQSNETDFTLSVEVITEPVDNNREIVPADSSSYSEMTEEIDPTDRSTPSPISPIPDVNNSLGYIKPYWMPDQDAPTCLLCMIRFTVLKRRHHCRACGKVYCANCCNQKAKLPYLGYKDARVCNTCYDLLDHEQIEQNAQTTVNPFNPSSAASSASASPNSSPSHRPNLAAGGPSPNLSVSSIQPSSLGASGNSVRNQRYSPVPSNPLEYCSAVPPTEQANTSNSVPVVFVPVSALRRPDKPRRDAASQKQVIFSDGIRPGGDLTESPDSSLGAVGGFGAFGTKLGSKSGKRFKLPQIPEASGSTSKSGRAYPPVSLWLRDSFGELPPLIGCDQLNEDSTPEELLAVASDPLAGALQFQLIKNLTVRIKRTRLDCCSRQLCWVCSTAGLSSVGQDEVLVVLECETEESSIPRDLFRLVRHLHDCANRGQPFNDLNHILFADGLFGSSELAGFLFFRPSFHCLQQLHLPSTPFMVALLIHKPEVPWAKIFPLRLLLRLGADIKQYPCPIVSNRSRQASFDEVGHTIMNVLADFRNFQYTMPFIPGLFVHMHSVQPVREITVSICKSRHDQVLKALSSSNEHVLAFGACFNQKAAAHFTCSKGDDGQYRSELFTSQNRLSEYRYLSSSDTSNQMLDSSESAIKTQASFTSALSDLGLSSNVLLGANFIVFSGALKSSAGLSAKFSVVEDGFLVQIFSTTLDQFKAALKECKDFTISCGAVDSETPYEIVRIVWEKEDKYFNVGVRSLIDGLAFDGVQSVRIQSGTDCVGEKYLLRWVEVFFIEYDKIKRREFAEPTRMANLLAHSLCVALTPQSEQLYESGINRIALRVTLHTDNIGYEVSSNKGQLQSTYANELDNALIPIIMGNLSSGLEELLVMELLFHILEK